MAGAVESDGAGGLCYDPGMPVKTEKELSEAQRSHWLKAVAALELRNFGYAISLLQGILKQETEFRPGRQLCGRGRPSLGRSG